MNDHATTPAGPREGELDREALIRRLYDLEIHKDLEPWMDMWEDGFVITYPFATNPALVPIRGKGNLRTITRQKFIDRERIELGVRVMPLADPLKALVYLGVSHTLLDGRAEELPLLCVFTFNRDGLISSLEEFFNEAALAAT